MSITHLKTYYNTIKVIPEQTLNILVFITIHTIAPINSLIVIINDLKIVTSHVFPMGVHLFKLT